MDPSDDSQVGPSGSGGHFPIHGRTGNTATCGEKRESTRSGSVSALAEPSNQDVDSAIDPNVSSCHMQSMISAGQTSTTFLRHKYTAKS
jgi:hypothetical protein